MFQDHGKIIEFQEKLMEKSLNFGSVIHRKIIEFWTRHGFD